MLLGVVVTALCARLGVLGAALAIDHEDRRAAVILGVLTMGFGLGERLLRPLTRIRLERDVYRATVEALLDSDVLDVSRDRSQRAVFEGIFHAVQLTSTVAPALLTDLVGLTVVVPVVALLFSPRVVVAALVAIGLIGGAVIVARRFAQDAEQRMADAYDALADALLFAVEGRLELVARGAEPWFKRRFASLSDAYVRVADRSGAVSALLGRAPVAVGVLAVGAIAILDRSARAEFSTALLTRALVLAACLPPVLGVVVNAQALARVGQRAAALVALLSSARRGEGSGIVVSLPASFELESVSFCYREDQPAVLTDVSFTWTGAEPLVLVGANGSGKSTLLKLLMGLRPPTHGVLRIDGHPVSAVDLRALRRSVSYLPQRPYLGEPHGSVRAALRSTVPDAADDAMKRCLARIGVYDALRAHADDPLALTIEELSAGQRQRVALARVVLQDAPVVLLDEPDANLDLEGIELVAGLVEELCAAGKMVAIAAHTPRLAALSTRPVRVDARGAPPTSERRRSLTG